MKAVIAALVILAAAPSAFAADAPKTAPAPNYFSLQPVALPVIAGGQVVNYVFVTVRIDLTPGADSEGLRAREPYFRDALVREAHRTPFTVATDYTRIDVARLCAALLADARAIPGGAGVADVRVMQQTPKTMRVPSPQ